MPDVWVMDAWAKKMDVDPVKIYMLADGDGSFHRSLGAPCNTRNSRRCTSCLF
jgi:peroxiredoxin